MKTEQENKQYFDSQISTMLNDVSSLEKLNKWINTNKSLFESNPYSLKKNKKTSDCQFKISNLKLQSNILHTSQPLSGFQKNTGFSISSSPGWTGVLWVKSDGVGDFKKSYFTNSGIHIGVGGGNERLKFDLHLFAHDFKTMYFQSMLENIRKFCKEASYLNRFALMLDIMDTYKALEKYPELILDKNELVVGMRQYLKHCKEYKIPKADEMIIDFEKKHLIEMINDTLPQASVDKKRKL